MNNKLKINISLIISVLLLFSSKTYAQQQTNSLLDSLTAEIRSSYGVPAICGIYITPESRHFGIQGTTKIDGNHPVDLTSKFHLGSNTKAITSFIVMKLAEEGLLSTDTRFTDVFPELRDSIKPIFRNVTIAQLLSHQAGLQPYTATAEFEKLPKMTGNRSEKRLQFAKRVFNDPKVSEWTYTNSGFILAALMVERICNKPYEQVLADHMQNNKWDFFIGFPNKQSIDYPWGHDMVDDQLVALAPNDPYRLEDFVMSAGDMSMTPIDYSFFVQKNLQGLQGMDNYLTANSYQKIHFYDPAYSFGWGFQTFDDSKVSFHNGSAGTYFCHTIIAYEDGYAISILLNSATEKHKEAAYTLRSWIAANRHRIK